MLDRGSTFEQHVKYIMKKALLKVLSIPYRPKSTKTSPEKNSATSNKRLKTDLWQRRSSWSSILNILEYCLELSSPKIEKTPKSHLNSGIL